MSIKETKLAIARNSYQDGQKNRGIIWCIAFVAMLLLAPYVMARPNYLSTFETDRKDISCELESFDDYEIYEKLLINIPVDSKILEIGCGTGNFSNYCTVKKQRIISTDISLENIKFAKKKYQNLTFFTSDAEILPLKRRSFDVVISIEVIEHLYDQRSHLLEVKRILKDTGIYIIKTPNKIYDRFVNFPYYIIFKGVKKEKLMEIHPSTKSLYSLKQLLLKIGFDIDFYSLGQLSKVQENKIGKISIIANKLLFRKYFPLYLQPSLFCIAKKNSL